MRTRSIAIWWLSLALLGIFAATLRASAVRSATVSALNAVGLTPDQTHAIYLPHIEKAETIPPTVPTSQPTPTYTPEPTPIPVNPTLRNGGFEEIWDTESSHRCLVFETDGTVWETAVGNIFTPPGWVTWFKHGKPVEHDPYNENGWSQPEVRDAWNWPPTDGPDRWHSGAKGQLLFTFWRVHDAGFFQKVAATPGQVLRMTGWAHAWSSNEDDPDCSDGSHVGCSPYFAYEGEPDLDGGDRNLTFQLGIDPTGGTNPYADTVVWGPGAHIYNAYDQVPPAYAVARNSTITVFLRSRTLWPFKHNDAYWDDIALEVVR